MSDRSSQHASYREYVDNQVIHTVDLTVDVTSMQPCVILGGDVLPVVVGQRRRGVRHRVSVLRDRGLFLGKLLRKSAMGHGRCCAVRKL
jgi:hypothetical protein